MADQGDSRVTRTSLLTNLNALDGVSRGADALTMAGIGPRATLVGSSGSPAAGTGSALVRPIPGASNSGRTRSLALGLFQDITAPLWACARVSNAGHRAYVQFS